MIISIAPDYAQFVAIVFWCTVLEGFLKIIVGLLQIKRDLREHYGEVDVMAGIILLLVVAWVMF